MLVIEVDGDTHGERQNYDTRRAAYLESKGYEVLRFTNLDVGSNLDGVLTMIADALNKPLSPALSPEGAREQSESSLSPLGERVRERGLE